MDGRNVRIIERFDNGDSSRFPGLATELVGLRVDVLFTTDVAMSAARQATTTIPIVCADFVDPVTEGVTRSMARPDSNVTGVSWQSAETAAKRLQFARELIPTLRRVALIYDASDPGIVLEAKGVSDAASIAKLHLNKFEVRSASDFKQAFAKIKHARPDVLLVSTNPLTWEQFPKIADFGARNRLPVISELPELAERGAVLTYGVDIFEAYRRGAYFVDKVLRGAKPSELPFEQAAKFDLVVNLKTAKALRISVPKSITNIATRVIR